MASHQIPGSAGPSSPDGRARADAYLYGGAASIVGILGLVIGAAYALLGNASAAAILAGAGVVLLVAGFVVARRRK